MEHLYLTFNVPMSIGFYVDFQTLEVEIIIWVTTVRPSVRPCVRTSVLPQKVSSISMKFGTQVVLDER